MLRLLLLRLAPVHEKAASSTPCRAITTLKSYLHAYIDGAGLVRDPKALLFQIYSRAAGNSRPTPCPRPQANAYAIIQRRARCTAQLYDRRPEEVTLGEIERVAI
jgi:hypothetical protein